jgi:hypothetical protein
VTFDEIIDSLINVDLVPDTKRQGKGYEAAFDRIHKDLPEIRNVEAVIYHESAHFAYAFQIFIELKRTPSGFAVLGPSIKYHPPKGADAEWYEHTISGVKVPGLETIGYTERNVKRMAGFAVSGGEAVEYYAAGVKRGVDADRSRFKDFYDKARLTVGPTTLPLSCDDYWNDAVLTVKKDFQGRRYNDRIQQIADTVKSSVYQAVYSNMRVIP